MLEKGENFLDPNHLIGKGGVTFIYSQSRVLYTQDSSITHKHILSSDDVWNNVIGDNDKLKGVDGASFKRRALAEGICLLGRTGTLSGKRLISFWGEDKELFSKYMTGCLKNLMEKGYAELKDKIYTFLFETNTVEGFLTQKFTPKAASLMGKNRYEIDGMFYTYDDLKDMRLRTHTQGSKKDLEFLCKHLTGDFVRIHPELQSLTPSNCQGNLSFRTPSKLQQSMTPSHGKWMYPVIGDSISFKNWLTISEIKSRP